VHDLVSPINSFKPVNILPLTASSSLEFNLNLTTPALEHLQFSVTPNPANSGTFTINYCVANAVSDAKIKVININTNSFTENTISTGKGSLSLNVTNYAAGSHSIVLICDGQTTDSKLFVVQ